MLTVEEEIEMDDLKFICANLLGQGWNFDVNTQSCEVNVLLDMIAELSKKRYDGFKFLKAQREAMGL